MSIVDYVLAIDPALSTTGYAVIDQHGELVYINKFTTPNSISTDERIRLIIAKLYSITQQLTVKYIVLEDGYTGQNSKTSLQLATLRGAIIGVFQHRGFQVYHMLPTQIRKALGCKGNANKEQVAQKVSEIYKNNYKLNIIGPYSDKQNKNKTSDIYDAISIGVAFLKILQEGSKQ